VLVLFGALGAAFWRPVCGCALLWLSSSRVLVGVPPGLGPRSDLAGPPGQRAPPVHVGWHAVKVILN
jgi:hypothetical protein